MLKKYIEAYNILCKHSLANVGKASLARLRIANLKDYNKTNLDIIASSIKNDIIKVAFDTRRIDQATEYNPRRNLQSYHRSEPYIDKDSSEKIKVFFKVKTAVDSIKDDFNGDPVWLDSYARILSCALDRTLRIDQKDFDFFKPQLDYLDELLYLRYRLKPDDIVRLNEKELRTLILDKDEKLMYKGIYANYNLGGINKNSNNESNTIIKGPDSLVDKLFGNVHASKENKSVSRSVTITINDKIDDEIVKSS